MAIMFKLKCVFCVVSEINVIHHERNCQEYRRVRRLLLNGDIDLPELGSMNITLHDDHVAIEF